MGLFDRFRFSGSPRAEKREDKAETPRDEALRLIDEGNLIEEAGQLDEALRCYDVAIEKAPDFARAYMNRGNILLAQGNAEDALHAYQTALELEPDYAAAHYNLANAYTRLDKNHLAKNAYEKAIELKSDFADAHVALGCVLEDLGQFNGAITSYRRALALHPEYAEVHCNLGNVFREIGELDHAIASYRKALLIDPDFAEAHLNLGITLSIQDQSEQAIACYRRALELRPTNANAHFALGLALKNRGQLELALFSLSKSVELNRDHIEAYINLADTLRDTGQSDRAIATYRKALEINPSHAIAHSNLGNALLDIGNYPEAMASYHRAIELDPNFAAAFSNLGSVLKDIGAMSDALANTRRALELAPELTTTRSNLIFISNYLENHSSEEVLQEAKVFGQVVAENAKRSIAWKNLPDPGRLLRIAFVSGDLRDHPVGHFIEGVLNALKTNVSDSLEIFAYQTSVSHDLVSQRIKACCKGWHSVVGLSDEVFAQKVQSDRIDILIDLSGHTAHNRLPLFAWKPAPIQATWLGYLGTTGVSAIDYLIADERTFPESEEHNFTEKILRLPETYICFTPPTANTSVSELPALENGYVTFGCFNNLSKINDQVVAVWSHILQAVPNSRLFLKSKQFSDPAIQQSMRDRFAALHIDPLRLILRSHVARSDYLVPYQEVDIALDPFPYPGITTTVESLWMGVPILTLEGRSFISRQGVGLAMNVGLEGWIARDQDHYVELAIKHTDDLNELRLLRANLRTRLANSPILDSQRFAAHFSTAMRDIWQRWCSSRDSLCSNSKQPNIAPLALGHYSNCMTDFALPPGYSSSQTRYTPSTLDIQENATQEPLLMLHVGGKEAKAGWKILNAQQFEGVDYIGDVRDLSAFNDGSCKKIYASHVMEHVSQTDFLPTLKGIHRILCSGGEFYLSVPDLEALCKLFLDPKLEGTQRFHVMRMMFGGQVDDFDFHFIGLTAEFMTDFFKRAGFSSARRVRSFGLFNDTSDFCPYGSPISLNMIAIK
jgi:protein O-GlcNAc transferase